MPVSLRRHHRQGALFILVLVFALAIAFGSTFTQPTNAADPCSVPGFTVSASLSVSAPDAVAVADFNKDGKPDMVAVTNRSNTTMSLLLGNGSGGFSVSPVIQGLLRSPTSIATGDFNGDGNADVVVGNGTNNNGDIFVYSGDGAGGLPVTGQMFLISGQNRISAVGVGDFNGDGKLDIAAASSTFNSILILTNNGNPDTGGFAFSRSISSGGSFPNFLLVKDLNGDAKADLVVANSVANGNVAVMLGDGTGNFSAAKTFLSGKNPVAVEAGDFDGDSKVDLAVTNSSPSNLTILRGDGAGNFTTGLDFSLQGTTGSALRSGDFNADGKLDLAVVASTSLVIFQGDGAGSFQPVANFFDGLPSLSSNPYGLAIADFNADTRPDVALTNETRNKLSVFLNGCGSAVASQLQFNPGGTGAFESTGSGTATIVRTGDLTGTASVNYASADTTAVAGVDYLPLSGTATFAAGEFTKAVNFSVLDDTIDEPDETFSLSLTNASGATLTTPTVAIISVFDDDPTPAASINDVAITEGNSGQTNAVFTVTVSNPSSSTITIAYATADGSANAGTDYQATSGTLTFAPGDLNKVINVPIIGDPAPEINETFLVNLSNPVNATLTDSQGLGTIVDNDSSCPAPSFGAGIDFTVNNPFGLASADFNRDGKLDLAVGNRSANSSISILLGNGSGGFAAPTTISGVAAGQIVAADLNLDGKMDLVSVASNVSNTSNVVSVMLGDGNGGFAVSSPQPVSNLAVGGVAVADFNSDGKPDLVLLQEPGATQVVTLFGDGSGGFGSPALYQVGGSSTIFMIAADVNRDGKPDVLTANLNSNNVSVLLNNGSGVLGQAKTFAAGSGPQSLAVGDINGDGKVDLIVANTFSTISLLSGDGAGAFSSTGTITVGARPFGLALADLNGDGNLDVAVGDIATGTSGPGGVWALFGNGAGAFTTPIQYTVGNNPGAVVAGDFNLDGKLDLATAVTQSSKATLLLNTCSGSTLSFSAPTYSINEAGGTLNITVKRGGDVSAPATVNYATSDGFGVTACNVTTGDASSRCDYSPALGTLRFAVNETSQVIPLRITDDSYREGSETLQIKLSAATGAIISDPGTATITILDNDASSGANPIDISSFFVRQHYIDFLNREPDQSGLDFWTGQITSCGSDLACTEVKRINVSAAFFLSIEFQQTGYLVERMYKVAFGDGSGTSTVGGSHQLTVPVVRFNEFLRDTQRIGFGVVVLQPGWEQLLENNKQAYAGELVATSRFIQAFPTNLTPAAFVDKLNQNAGNVLSASERTTAINLFGGAVDSSSNTARAQALRQVAEDQNLYDSEFNRAFVLTQYFGYLRRNPNDSPDSDYTGYDFWLGKLNEFHGDYIAAEMVKAFISSTEYRRRFGP